ncbi:hypothetical protein BsWGS_04531 [Bradybaena similaris]
MSENELARPRNGVLKWSTSYSFIGMYMCNIVGLGGHVWDFQHLVYLSGGGAFLIPYTVCFFCLAAPLMLLEYTLGQYTNASPLKCWEFCPIFSGCGVTMMMVSGIMAILYPVFLAWGFYFLYKSFAAEVPWTKCGPWSTPNCSDNVQFVSKKQCLSINGSVAVNGICKQQSLASRTIVWNLRLAENNGFRRNFAAEEYFERVVTRDADHNIFNLGAVRLSIVLNLILTWVLVWLLLVKGIHVSAKMFIWSMSLPTAIFVVLLVRGQMLDGSLEGVLFYIIPDESRVFSLQIWKDAAVQVLYTSSLAFGGQIALARYNDFHYDLVGCVLFMAVATTLCNIIVGIMIFSYVGFLSKLTQSQINKVIRKDPAMIMKVLPAAMTRMKGTTYWSIMYFYMATYISLGSEILYLETFISCILDIKPELTKNRAFVLTGVCFVMFILSLPVATQGGQDLVVLIYFNTAGLNILVVAMCECISVGWIYGADRFLDDLNYIIGKRCCKVYSFGKFHSLWFNLCWKIISPGFLLFILFYPSEQYYQKVPLWGSILAVILSFSGILIIISMASIKLAAASGTFKERLLVICSPTDKWGSVLIKQVLLTKRSRIMLNIYNKSQQQSEDNLNQLKQKVRSLTPEREVSEKELIELTKQISEISAEI